MSVEISNLPHAKANGMRRDDNFDDLPRVLFPCIERAINSREFRHSSAPHEWLQP
jgi:hypothetical protein